MTNHWFRGVIYRATTDGSNQGWHSMTAVQHGREGGGVPVSANTPRITPKRHCFQWLRLPPSIWQEASSPSFSTQSSLIRFKNKFLWMVAFTQSFLTGHSSIQLSPCRTWYSGDCKLCRSETKPWTFCTNPNQSFCETLRCPEGSANCCWRFLD